MASFPSHHSNRNDTTTRTNSLYTHTTRGHHTEAATQEGADRLAAAAAILVYDMCGGMGDRPCSTTG